MSYPDITSACGLPPIGPRALAPLIRQRILTVTLVSRPMNHVCVISLEVGKGKTIQGKTLHLFWLVRLMLQAEDAFFEGMSVLFFFLFILSFFFLLLVGFPIRPFFLVNQTSVSTYMRLDPAALNRIKLCTLKAHVKDKLCPKQLSLYPDRGTEYPTPPGWEPNHREICAEITA